MVAITYQGEENQALTLKLAKEYQLEFVPFHLTNQHAGLILTITTDYIGLLQGPTEIYKSKPFYIDFYSGELAYRSAQAGLKKEFLARAIGLKPKDDPFIVDATAGIGKDAFILASLGFKITMLERSPILWLLMDDALKRARAHSSLEDIIANMTYLHIDAHEWLKAATNPRPDVIYLDPMFPHRKKAAAVKKEMVILQDLVGNDEDAADLLKLALSCANNRVVVKRPRLAAPLADLKPSFSLTGKSSRFDIYMV